MTLRTSLLGALAVLCLLAGPASAEEGAKSKVSFRPRWKAGDVVTHISEETENEDVKVLGPDGKALSEEVKTTETAVVYVLKCVEADGAGHIKKGIVHFSEFSMTVGKDKDETLKGRTYEVNGIGKDRKVVSMDSGKPESEAAMAWLAKKLGAESHADEEADAFTPKQAVGAGDVVEVPMKAFAEAAGGAIPIDVEKSSGKVTIEAMSPESVTWVFDMAVATKGHHNPTSGALMAWVEGGNKTLKGRRAGKPGAPAPSESSFEYELAGTATEQGVKVVLKVTGKESQKSVVGGEFPKPPEPPAPAPDKPAPDKPEPGKPEPEKPAPDKPEK